jgi:hypothetical protein
VLRRDWNASVSLVCCLFEVDSSIYYHTLTHTIRDTRSAKTRKLLLRTGSVCLPRIPPRSSVTRSLSLLLAFVRGGHSTYSLHSSNTMDAIQDSAIIGVWRDHTTQGESAFQVLKNCVGS